MSRGPSGVRIVIRWLSGSCLWTRTPGATVPYPFAPLRPGRALAPLASTVRAPVLTAGLPDVTVGPLVFTVFPPGCVGAPVFTAEPPAVCVLARPGSAVSVLP